MESIIYQGNFQYKEGKNILKWLKKSWVENPERNLAMVI